MTMLSALDEDTLLDILELLDVRSILALRLVSRRFARITRLRSVWHSALTNHILSKDLPLVRPRDQLSDRRVEDVHTLGSEDLEKLATTSVKASAIWRSKHPGKKRTIVLQTRLSNRVFKLAFLKIQTASGSGTVANYEGRFLLSFGHTAGQSLCAQIWDTESPLLKGLFPGTDGPSGLVSEWMEVGRAIGLAIDEADGLRAWATRGQQPERISDGAVFAISERLFEAPGEEVFFALRVFHFMPRYDGSQGRLSILQFFPLQGPVNLRTLHGCLIAIQVRADGDGQVFGHGSLKVVDWVRSSVIIAHEDSEDSHIDRTSAEGEEWGVELVPSEYGIHRSVLSVQFVHDWVIVFRESAVEMFFLPMCALRSSKIPGVPRRIRPTVTHRWPWQINSLSPIERVSWAHEQASRKCMICHGSGTIFSHLKDEDAPERLVCSCRYRPISVAIRFDSYFPWPVNLIHHYLLQVPISGSQAPTQMPYILPPKLLHTVPSTVHLFSHSVLTIGKYGELVWTDSECADDDGESFYLEGTGERLVGTKILLPNPKADDDDIPCIASLNMMDTVSENQQPAVVPGPAHGSSSISSIQMSQFAVRLSDSWYSLALCERAGRIAVGDGNTPSLIEVYDFM